MVGGSVEFDGVSDLLTLVGPPELDYTGGNVLFAILGTLI
jgi:hypothetical protein